MPNNDGVTVLTTEERAEWYKAVFGLYAHYVFDPARTDPLPQYLNNLKVASANLVVLDEAHFMSAEILAGGIRDFVDDGNSPGKPMRIIVVCSGRQPGDVLLAFLATYCHVYDIICATTPIDLTAELEHLASRPNERQDVLKYMRSYAALCKAGAEHGDVISKRPDIKKTQSIEVPAGMRITFVVEPLG